MAWCGDTQFCLVKNGKIEYITEAHKPGSQKEKERIEKEGGSVSFVSAAVKQKMSRSDFGKNLAGANGGADFAPPLLDALYASVTVRPMLVPDAGGGGGGGDGEAGSLSRAASSAGGWGRRSSRGGGGGGGGGGASGASRRRARWWACFAKG